MTNQAANSGDTAWAEIILPGNPLAETLSFFTDELGFRVDSIYPADAPRVAVISGRGIRLRLDANVSGEAGTIRMSRHELAAGEVQSVAPNGTVIDFVDTGQPLLMPPIRPSLAIRHPDNSAGFGEGRAGMQYRDLISDRYGGCFIASHIRIVDGGPVADYVHHHHIRFQMIFCVRGWVNVVYEDQGPPILLEAGDCFLQPPHIRHRVLESSDNMEVVEIACPAEHETCVDHDIALPTECVNPERNFGGQKFVFHSAKKSPWLPWHVAGFEYQDTGINDATNGIANAVVVRASGAADDLSLMHDEEIRFLFVLQGKASFAQGNERCELGPDSSCAIPAGLPCELSGISTNFKMLEVFVSSR
jgi:mannose-6-phosphate isomerase-like protein (cupin superfamily)